MNSMKMQEDMTPEDETHRLVGAQYDTGEAQRHNSGNLCQNGNYAQWWICVVLKVKANAVKNNTA